MGDYQKFVKKIQDLDKINRELGLSEHLVTREIDDDYGNNANTLLTTGGVVRVLPTGFNGSKVAHVATNAPENHKDSRLQSIYVRSRDAGDCTETYLTINTTAGSIWSTWHCARGDQIVVEYEPYDAASLNEVVPPAGRSGAYARLDADQFEDFDHEVYLLRKRVGNIEAYIERLRSVLRDT